MAHDLTPCCSSVKTFTPCSYLLPPYPAITELRPFNFGKFSSVQVCCPHLCIIFSPSVYTSAGTDGDCTQVAFSLLVGVAVGQMEQVAVSAFHKVAEGRVDGSLQRVTEAQNKCHLTLPT